MNAADWVPVADLVAWDKNPKPHGQENIKEIARSIRRFDFGAPIVAWRSKRQVVAGHGRLLGAALLVREDPGRLLATDAPGPGLVPVRWVEFASDTEAAAYALADNRLTEVNPMTDTAVANILREIEAEGGDINVPGYSEDDLSALLSGTVSEVAFGQTPEDGADAFADSNVKRVTLVYPKEDYTQVIELLDSALKKYGVSDYSNLVLELLKHDANR